MNIPEYKFDAMCLELLKVLYEDGEYKDILTSYNDWGQTPEMNEVEIVLSSYGIYRYINYN